MSAGRARQQISTPPAPARFAAQRLSREEIVAAAVATADRDGVDAVSMRRIAAVLGSGTMSLYRHVGSREQLLDLMIDSAYAEIELPARPTGAWRHDLTLLAHAQRRAMRAHSWAALLVGSRPPVLAGFLRPFEFALAALTGAGLEITDAAGAAATLNAFITGFTLYEHAEEEARRRTGLTKEDWRARNAPLVERILASGDYPAVSRFVERAQDLDQESAFEAALRRILDGIQASLPAASALI
jgi:AcrR family transcriptional regulator